MNKYDFIRELNAHLKGKVSDQEFADTIAYYEDYIDAQIKAGKSEEEVIAALGSPRLLAKSIVTASSAEEDKGFRYESRSYSDDYDSYGDSPRSTSSKIYINGRGIPVWLVLILTLIITACILVLVCKALIFLAPVILVIACAIIIYKFLTGKL